MGRAGGVSKCAPVIQYYNRVCEWYEMTSCSPDTCRNVSSLSSLLSSLSRNSSSPDTTSRSRPPLASLLLLLPPAPTMTVDPRWEIIINGMLIVSTFYAGLNKYIGSFRVDERDNGNLLYQSTCLS